MADKTQAYKQLFDSLKDKFQGFDSNGNAIIKDGEEVTSFDNKDFKELNDMFRQANPDMKEGSYEQSFNKNQFEDIAKQGNKFQGFDESGNLIYRNQSGDLENFGKQGGFAEFAKQQMAGQKFDASKAGFANQVQGENTQLNPFQQRQGLGAIANMQKAENNIARPGMVSDRGQNTNPAPEPGSSVGGGFGKFYQSQMEKNAQQQNQQTARQRVKKPQQAQQPPSLTGMAMGFAQQQAQKLADKQKTAVINEADAQARKVAQPYVQQATMAAKDLRSQAGSAIQQATGVDPFTSLKQQAVSRAAGATGVDSGLLNQGLAAVSNPQQAVQNLAKQQLTDYLAKNTGADAGLISQGLGAALSGNVGQAATNLAKQQAINYAQNLAAQQGLNMVPGGVGSALAGIQALSGKGTTEQKSSAAAKAAARAALASSTGGLSELVSPETMALTSGGLTSLKDSKFARDAGVAGQAVKGAAGLGSGVANTTGQLGNIGMNAIGDTGASTARMFKGATEGIKNLTQGNIAEGLKGLGSTALKGALDTFIKNPANVIGNLGSTAAKTVGKVLNAINVFCFDGDTKILMADKSYKKIKDIKVDDMVFLGGKVTAIGTAKVQGLYDYNGVKVSSDHAVFERGVWKRIKNTKDGVKLHDDEVEVYPISTEHHLVITEGGQIFADMDEVDDTYNKTDDQIIKELNGNVKRNKVLNAFHKTFIGKI